jgi:hypothetical protein
MAVPRFGLAGRDADFEDADEGVLERDLMGVGRDQRRIERVAGRLAVTEH